MDHGIVIIGAGFAARQVVKNLRKVNPSVNITLIASDSADEYNKPDLSHVISLSQCAADMTRQTAADFAEQMNLTLVAHTEIVSIDTAAKVVKSADASWNYSKLVLATGSSAFVPPVKGGELFCTLNSQMEYQRCQDSLRNAKKVLILGGGLIGTELAMDFTRAGKKVTLVDTASSILSSLMPAEVSSRLQARLVDMGVDLRLKEQLQSLEQVEGGVFIKLSEGKGILVDAAVAAVGLRSNISLARDAGIEVNRGICVNDQMVTSNPDVFAVGDCAEINGKVLPFLQPHLLSAMTLAQNILGGSAQVKLPNMLVKVKTPDMPLHLAGDTGNRGLNWVMQLGAEGMLAKGFDADEKLKAFVVSEDRMKEAFGLLKSLS